MIGGGGEQLTLRAVARLADACNVGGTPDVVRHKFEVLRRHCEARAPQLRRDRAAPTSSASCWRATRPRWPPSAASSRFPAQFDGFAGTVAQVTDLIGRYRDAGVQLLISSAYKNDVETLELLAADVMPAFAG